MMKRNPADASTVILVRPCADPGIQDIEILLVLKSSRDSFVPGNYVFPGGSIEPSDYHPDVDRFMLGIDRRRAAAILPDMSQPQKAIGAWVAAFREIFEETGLLLAVDRNQTPQTVGTDDEVAKFGSYRQALIRGEITFSRMLEAEELFLPLENLFYFSHWITPEPFSLRYDVRFFLARTPLGQTVVCDGQELTNHVWVRPSAALQDYRGGRIDMVLPQLATIEELTAFQTVEQAVAAAIGRQVPAVLTRIEKIDGKNVEVMPDGTVFPVRPPVYP